MPMILTRPLSPWPWWLSPMTCAKEPISVSPLSMPMKDALRALLEAETSRAAFYEREGIRIDGK